MDEAECAAQRGYTRDRAEIELRLADEIEEWRYLNESYPPRLYVESEIVRYSSRSEQSTAAVGVDEFTICHGLWRPILSYLTNEIENFSALLFFNGTRGLQAITALRSHFESLVNELREHKWPYELRRFNVSEQGIENHWPATMGNRAEFLGPYERFVWQLESGTDAEWPGAIPLEGEPSILGIGITVLPRNWNVEDKDPDELTKPDLPVLATDEEHARHVKLFDLIKKRQKVESWLSENPTITRSQIYGYRAGNFAGKISPEKRLQIEEVIRVSAVALKIISPDELERIHLN